MNHWSAPRECEPEPAVICTQLIGQADPLGTISTYGQQIVHELRDAAATEPR